MVEPAMTDRQTPEPQTLQQLPHRIFDEINRQFRAVRNDILRYGVWNVRNMTDEEFNHADDRRLLGYFQQDLLETRFINKGRRIDIVQVWNWFDDQTRAIHPLLMEEQEILLNIQDKDLEKVRKRIEELGSFLAILRADDLEGFKRVKFKLRRTVLRLTYDLHHLTKRMDKYRKGLGGPIRSGGSGEHAEPVAPPADALADPLADSVDEHEHAEA
jgi:hypothetical protein